LAEPQALAMAVSAAQAIALIGMPEGRIPLAEVTIFLGFGAEIGTRRMLRLAPLKKR